MSIYYEPKRTGKPVDCIDITDYELLCQEIARDSSLTMEQRRLLTLLATRFLQFKYEKLADYYTITDANMQKWLEKLRCVIVDTDSAIQNGYISYKKNYQSLIGGIVNEK